MPPRSLIYIAMVMPKPRNSWPVTRNPKSNKNNNLEQSHELFKNWTIGQKTETGGLGPHFRFQPPLS